MTRRREVVITGMGVVSSLGSGLDAHWRHLVGKSTGIWQVTQAPLSTALQYAGRVEPHELPADTPS
ncbi:MAG: beta-ketoacyl synthase N-terminal-like domain-containing protein, partial [Candidatus Methylomirabilis sp.]